MIINLTQHAATPEQSDAGVVDLTGAARERLIGLLTFEQLPTIEEIAARAAAIAQLVSGDSIVAEGLRADAAMIGGAPYLMSALEAALRAANVRPLYAFSVRESVEVAMPDGTVKKTAVFKHGGFVEV